MSSKKVVNTSFPNMKKVKDDVASIYIEVKHQYQFICAILKLTKQLFY